MSEFVLHLSLTIGIITESVKELGKKPCKIKALKHMSQSLVLRSFWVTTRLKIKSNKLMNILL